MRFGYLRFDDSGHEYVVPEDKIKQFELLLGDLEGTDYMDCPDLYDTFEDLYGQYRVGGVLDLKVLMEES